MKPFPGWRNVGRAMRWARQQDGVTVAVDDEGFRVVDIRWRRGRDSVIVQHFPGLDMASVSVKADGSTFHQNNADAVRTLRVLAALKLIPAGLAERDERYGRCVKCKNVLFWRAGRDELPDRWGHVDRRAYIAFGTHRAEAVG
jgi:hypothetical protein